jgi:hypothetical protein
MAMVGWRRPEFPRGLGSKSVSDVPVTEMKKMMMQNVQGGVWLPARALEKKRNPLN